MRHIARLLLLLAVLLPGIASATSDARTIADPVSASQPVFGRIDVPGEVDFYTFTASRDITLSIELAIPVRPTSRNFQPIVTVYRPGVSETSVPVGIPAGYSAEVIPPDPSPSTLYEPISAERLIHVSSRRMSFSAGQPIYLTVSEPSGRTGDYIVGLGSATDFSNISIFGLFGRTLAFKLGLSEGRSLPLGDAVGLFIAVVGTVLALGTLTLASLLSIFARESRALFRAARSSTTVVVSLLWGGFAVYYAGLSILYRQSGFSGPGTIQEVLLLFMLIVMIYTTFVVRPRLHAQDSAGAREASSKGLRRRVILSLISLQVLWWGQVGLLSWYVIAVR